MSEYQQPQFEEEYIEEEGIDLEAIARQYEERGFFRRLGDMFKGLQKPVNTREYKLARIELQRLIAPLVAIVVPVLGVVVLIVVTAMGAQKKPTINVEIGQIEDEPDKLEVLVGLLQVGVLVDEVGLHILVGCWSTR
jgi:hypothetical protein